MNVDFNKFGGISELDMLLLSDTSEEDELTKEKNSVEFMFDDYVVIDNNIPVEGFRYWKIREELPEVDYLNCLVCTNEKKATYSIDEFNLAKAIVKHFNMVYYYGKFYTSHGIKSEDVIKKYIYNLLGNVFHLTSDLAGNTAKIFNALIIEANNVDESGNMRLAPNPYRIPFANGTLFVYNKLFVENYYEPTLYRLNVKFKPDYTEPRYLNKWIDDAIFDEDKRAFIDYMGYLFVPTTQAQKCLFVVGDGSIGKTMFNTMLTDMFGTDAIYNVGNMATFLTNQFRLVNAVNKLCVFDDDIGTTPIGENDMFKQIITAKGKLPVEKKGKDAIDMTLFARFIIFGNHMITLPSNSDPAYIRRFLPIYTKPYNKNRVNIPEFDKLLISEKEDIAIKFLTGLYDLIDLNFNFSEIESNNSKAWAKHIVEDIDPISAFFNDLFKVTSNDDDFISTKDIINAYTVYSRDNKLQYNPNADTDIRKWLLDHEVRLGIEQSRKNNLRGFKRLKMN